MLLAAQMNGNIFDILRLVLSALGKDESLMKYVPDRLGHDRRYAIDATKIRTELGWAQATSFETGVQKTIQGYFNNR